MVFRLPLAHVPYCLTENGLQPAECGARDRCDHLKIGLVIFPTRLQELDNPARAHCLRLWQV
jgi:hypothetical protein